MGNRYGRNQKRRHREQIAALERARIEDKRRLDSALKRAADLDNEMQDWDEEIRRLLGTYSALRRSAPEFRSAHPIREMSIIEPMRFSASYGAEVAEMTMPTRERMRRFVFTLERDDIRMQRLIRFMETDGLGGVAYSISDAALAQGFGRREVAYLAHQIAENLANHWNARERAPAKSA